MEIDVILDNLVDEVEAVVIVFVVVDREVAMAVGVEGFDELWDLKMLHELVTRANINVAGRQLEGCASLVEYIRNGVVLCSFIASKVCWQGVTAEESARRRSADWGKSSD